jgi:ferredoxin
MAEVEFVQIVETPDGPQALLRNFPGKYFVTEECEGCAYCALVAAAHFEFDKKSNTYFVCRQPEGGAELELVIEAMDDCPVSAIHVHELADPGVVISLPQSPSITSMQSEVNG